MISGVDPSDRDSTTASYFEDVGGLLGSPMTTSLASYPEVAFTGGLLLNNTVAKWLEMQMENVTDMGVNSTEVPYTPYEYRPETYIIPIVFALIFIVGVLGNGTLVIVFLKHRTMRNVPNTWVDQHLIRFNRDKIHFIAWSFTR